MKKIRNYYIENLEEVNGENVENVIRTMLDRTFEDQELEAIERAADVITEGADPDMSEIVCVVASGAAEGVCYYSEAADLVLDCWEDIDEVIKEGAADSLFGAIVYGYERKIEENLMEEREALKKAAILWYRVEECGEVLTAEEVKKILEE